MNRFIIIALSMVGLSLAQVIKPQATDSLSPVVIDSIVEDLGIPTQKSVYNIHLDWQKPSKCVDSIASALKTHHAWRLYQQGRDRANYKVPKEEAQAALESLKALSPTQVFVQHSDLSSQIVHNGARYIALDTLNRHYQLAINDSENPNVIAQLANALDQLENERNQVIHKYLEHRLETQSVELNITCRPFAPPVVGEARVAVPWLNQVGIDGLEEGY